MRIKDIQDENFQDYKKISMFICTSFCDGKCYKELGKDSSMCQNDNIKALPTLSIEDEKIVSRYINNPITKAVVIGGLEPFMQREELYALIRSFRQCTQDDIVIYTGYREDELQEEVQHLQQFSNIIIKFGRYIPERSSQYDDILGISLASDNQYAVKIS